MARARHSGLCVLALGISFAALVACERQPGPPEPGARQAAAPTTAERFRAHMKVLADDSMRGRETGTPGYQLAAEYVAAQFAALGLQPAGENGSWYQQVPFLTSRLEDGSAGLQLERNGALLEFAFPDDFVMTGGFGSEEDSISAPLVFVGFGVVAPHHDHDDFARLDVTNRIVVRLTGAPERFPTDERAYYSSEQVKDGFAVERGAIGVLVVRAPADLSRLPWGRYLSAVGSREMRWTMPDGRPHDAFPALRGRAVLSEAGAAKLFALAGRSLEATFAELEGGTVSHPEMGVVATLKRRSVHARLQSPNVVGLLPGSDPALSDQYLLYTAHLDHLGTRAQQSGDAIFNGAYDNAAGVATLLEAARAFASNERSARRSILFAALTGEEQGLQGSSFMAQYPPVPVDNIVAVINIDMPYLGFPIAEIIGLGVEHSSLQATLVAAAGRAALEYIPDPRPELVRLIRSDQWSFVQRGIPGLNLKPGARSRDPVHDGPTLHDGFLREHYHQPSDDLDLPFSATGAERFTRVAVELGAIVANAEQRPAWNPGDFFAQLFANHDRGKPDDGSRTHAE